MKKFFKKHSWLLFLLVGTIAVYFFILKNLFLNFSTHLFDWNDYPLYAWILEQHLDHFLTLNWQNFFQGNIFHSFPDVLLFSDLFLPQALMALIFRIFTQDPIVTFNLVFAATILLNTVTSYYFWQSFFRKKKLIWFASVLTLFSVFTFRNWYHLQIFSLWPFLLTAGYFFRSQQRLLWLRGVVAGLLLSTLFYSSIYLWLILVTILGLWFLLGWLKKKIDFKSSLKFLLTAGSIFILLSGYTIYRYWQVRQHYQTQRDYNEYVQYAFHLTDYLFPYQPQTPLYQRPFAKKWQSYNRHLGVFPGFVLTALFLLGVVQIKNQQQKLSLNFNLRLEPLFFLLLLIIGFVFSLGPRLNVNGAYAGLPLPYHFILKLPLYEAFRVPNRWSLLVFLAMIYFAAKALKKFKSPTWLLLLLVPFYLIETVPLKTRVEAKNYYPAAYEVLEEQCQTEENLLLEYPMTQDKKEANTVTNLSYRTQMMLASTQHGCDLVNGYSGYIPQAYSAYETQLFQAVENEDQDLFVDKLEEKGVDYLKLNRQEIYPHKLELLEAWLQAKDQFKPLTIDEDYIIVELL